MTAAWPFDIDRTEDLAYWQGAFTPDECQQIIDLGNAKTLEAGLIRGDNTTPTRDHVTRDSSIAWLEPNADTQWIYRRVTDIIMDLNARYFGYDLWGLAEQLQFTRYDAPGGHYGRHVDRIQGGPIRKLSMTLQLSDPTDYDGGELAIYLGEEPNLMPRARGHMTVFPSHALHEVMPVTRGTRHSLVAWVTGKPFR